MYKVEDCFIYCISDPETKEPRYIGKTVYGKKRFNSHISKNQLKTKTKKNNWIKKLLKNGKQPHFEILEYGEPNNLAEMEIFYISYFKFLGFNLLNMTIGGEGCLGIKRSIETRKKLSEKLKGKIVSKETRIKISEAQKGRMCTEEQKLRFRNRKDCKKVVHLQTGIIYKSIMECSRVFNISSGALSDCLNSKTTHVNGNYFSFFDETQDDIFFWCIKELQRLNTIHLKNKQKHFQYKKIKCLQNGIIYESIKDAAAKLNICNTSISKVLSGERKKARGYTFVLISGAVPNGSAKESST